jgi:hypothetical protein
MKLIQVEYVAGTIRAQLVEYAVQDDWRRVEGLYAPSAFALHWSSRRSEVHELPTS